MVPEVEIEKLGPRIPAMLVVATPAGVAAHLIVPVADVPFTKFEPVQSWPT